MRTLSEKEGYAKYFKVVAAKMVGVLKQII
jgi:hypothetical protein